MLSEVYKKRETAVENGRPPLFFVVVTNKGKNAPQRAKKKETTRGKTATLPYEKMPLRAKKKC